MNKKLIMLFLVLYFFMFLQLLPAHWEWDDPSAANAEIVQTYSKYKDYLRRQDKLITNWGYDFAEHFIEFEMRFCQIDSSDTVMVIINRNVYDYMINTVYSGGPDSIMERYLYHLEQEYNLIICVYDGKMDIDTDAIPFDRNISPPDFMRDEIITRYLDPAIYGNLVGCIFIGELPVKWYLHEEDTGGGLFQILEFPIDLYYMDMDRNLDTWEDAWINNADGLLVDHTYDIKPEIWVGRITASTIYENEIPALVEYFNKNIAYREREEIREKLEIIGDSALVFDGADNIEFIDGTNFWIEECLKELIYGPENVEVRITHPIRTNARTFLTEITDPDNNYELVHFGITSSAFTHTFDSEQYKYLAAGDIKDTGLVLDRATDLDILPPFYVIAGAGAARFTANDYIGGSLIFSSSSNVSMSNGLTLVGSTKSRGIMQEVEYFYNRLRFRCFGESLCRWIDAVLDDMTNNFKICNGMTIIGDPTFKLLDIEIPAAMRLYPTHLDAFVNPDTGGHINFELQVMERSGRKGLHSIMACSTDFPDAAGNNDIHGEDVVFTISATVKDIPPGTDIPPGGELCMWVTIPVPAGFRGPSNGEIIVLSEEGITEKMTVTIITNRPPVALAGEDQLLYSGSTGNTDVQITLDGSCSYDPDGDSLLYSWYENGNFIASGVNPTVLLPAGEHNISLFVCDAGECSKPDHVTITIVETVKGDLRIESRVINRRNHGYWVKTKISFPGDIKREDVDMDYKVKLFSKEGKSITADSQYIWPRYHYHGNGVAGSRFNYPQLKKFEIIAWYLCKNIIKEIPADGVCELTQVSRLKTGQYLNGKNSIMIIGKTMKPTHLRIKPWIIHPNHLPEKVKTYLILPLDVISEDVDMNTKVNLTNLSGESIEALEQYLYPGKKKKGNLKYVKVIAYFSPEDLLTILPNRGWCRLYQECKLVSGDSLVGFWIIIVR